MPLSRVRNFIAVDGGPTPRDAVLLKSLLVVHEGIAWATDRPHYRYSKVCSFTFFFVVFVFFSRFSSFSSFSLYVLV